MNSLRHDGALAGEKPRRKMLDHHAVAQDIATPDLPHIDNVDAVLRPQADEPKADPPHASQQPAAAIVEPPKQAAALAPPTKPPLIKPPAESKKLKLRPPERTKTPKPEDKPEVRRTSAPPTLTAWQSETAAAPSSSASLAPTISVASWKGALLALLNRNKRYPAGATSFGTASVAFAIDRAGAVRSARLIASSGDAALDEEAVALLRRSSPVPAPPPEFGRGVVTLTVPIRFSR